RDITEHLRRHLRRLGQNRGHIDDGVDVVKRAFQALTGREVCSSPAAQHRRLVTALVRHIDDVPTDGSGSPCYCDPHAFPSPLWFTPREGQGKASGLRLRPAASAPP